MQLILNIIRTLQFACGLVCLVIDTIYLVEALNRISHIEMDSSPMFIDIILSLLNIIGIERLENWDILFIASEIINVPLRRNNAVNNAGIETVETNNAGTEINNAGAEWNA
ncbi:22260_t:CDS:2 [Rhizophagus irregularis]|nr:22260_t:CDS:2 [Rhizophagus irregularis]